MNAQLLPLKPMQLPPDPGFWPWPPGVWLILALTILGALLITLWRRSRGRAGATNTWLTEALQAEFARGLPAPQLAQAVNVQLKRWALARGAEPALQGESWFRYLQAQTPDTGRLPAAARHFLLVQAYQPHASMPAEALAAVEKSLLRFARDVSRRPHVKL